MRKYHRMLRRIIEWVVFALTVHAVAPCILLRSGGQVSGIALIIDLLSCLFSFQRVSGMKKFHKRTYGVVPITKSGNAFQVSLSFS